MSETDTKTCAVCARVLNKLERDGEETTWIHGLGSDADHIAVPVEQDEVQTAYRCDFCNQDEAVWTLPTSRFVMPGLENTGFTAGAGENWATCGACGELIDKNQWSALLRRVVASWETRYGTPMGESSQGALKALYRELRKNIKGSMKPFTP